MQLFSNNFQAESSLQNILSSTIPYPALLATEQDLRKRTLLK